MKTVFVVLSHTLTQQQIEDLGECNIILLNEVAPEMQAQCSKIPAKWDKKEIYTLACKVVAEANKAKATHFVCQGEPAFAMWANIIASSHVENTICDLGHELGNECPNHQAFAGKKALICIQSTTERVLIEETNHENGEVTKRTVFKHVQWRELF